MDTGTRSRTLQSAIRFRASCRTAEAVARAVRKFAATPRLGGEELASEIRSRKSAEGVATEGLGASG